MKEEVIFLAITKIQKELDVLKDSKSLETEAKTRLKSVLKCSAFYTFNLLLRILSTARQKELAGQIPISIINYLNGPF